MANAGDTLMALGGSLAGILAAAMYVLYRNRSSAASELQKVEMVKLGMELRKRLKDIDDQCISYAAVQGIVTDQGKTFTTENSSVKGVILQTSLVEHRSKRTQGIWSDVKKVMMENLECAPFTLSDMDSPGHQIMVMEATEANNLLDELEVTHHEFMPRHTSTLESGIDRILGEVSRGYEKSERMLAVGTSLMGIGEIILEDGKMKLRPPQTEGLKYYLTTMSKNQMVKLFQAQATSLKVLSIIFGLVASSMVGFVLWRVTKRYLEQRRVQKELEEIHRMRLRRHAQTRGNSSEPAEDKCVICLDNPREVVTLNCGHIAMCSNCAQSLPEPRCPVCRGLIERFVPTYRP